MKNKSLTKNSIFNIIYTVSNVLLPLISSIYVSRVLLPDNVGKVAFANSIVTYFVTVACLGLPNYGTYQISKCGEDKKQLNKTFSELFFINIISTTCCIIVFLILLFNINPLKNNKLLYAFCGIQIPICYINIDWLYKGKEEYGYITMRNIAIKILFLITLFIVIKKEEDYIWYALITSLALSLNHFFNIFHSRKFVKITFTDLNLKKHLKPVFFVAISIFLSNIYSQIDITMIGAMASDVDVGLYSNAHKIINIIITCCIAITGAMLPRISLLYQNDKEKFLNLINYGIRIITFIVIPATIALLLLSPNIILLFYGIEYEGSINILRCFSVLIIIKGYGDLICHQVIISIGEEKYLVPVAIIATIVNIALNAILIPKLYGLGAAIASVISELTLNIVLFIIVKKKIKFQINIKEIFLSLTSSLIMGISILFIKHFCLINWLECLICCFLGLLVYVFFNYILKNTILKEILIKLRRKKNN